MLRLLKTKIHIVYTSPSFGVIFKYMCDQQKSLCTQIPMDKFPFRKDYNPLKEPMLNHSNIGGTGSNFHPFFPHVEQEFFNYNLM